MLWNKKKNEKEKPMSDDRYRQALAENDVKSGFVKIFRVDRDERNRPKQFYKERRLLSEIAGQPIEDFLSAEYGGGEYSITLYKRTGASDTYIDTFAYRIDGPMDESNASQPAKNDKLADLAYKMIEKKISNGDNELTDIVKMFIEKSLNKNDPFSERLQELMTLKDLISPQVPVIPPETTEGKIIDALANIVPALLTSRAGGNGQPNIQRLLTQNPNLAQLPLPDQHISDIKTISPNGHNITKIQAFETLFISPFKELALQADEKQIAGMIETMAVDSLLWLNPEDYHPAIKEFVQGYEAGNIVQLAGGFDSLVKFANIPDEKAINIKNLLVDSYQSQYKPSPTDRKTAESEGANANE